MGKRFALVALITLFFAVTVHAADPWLPPFELDSALEGDVIIESVDVSQCWHNEFRDCVEFNMARSSDEELDYYIQMKTASNKILGSFLGGFRKGEKKNRAAFEIIPGTVLLKFNKDD